MSNFVPSPTQAGYIRSRQRPQYAVIFDPSPPVFRALLAVDTIGPSYNVLEFDTVSLGDYEDIRVGMTVIISETADHTFPIATYKDLRVADTPTSDTLPINETDRVFEAGVYITVLDTYKALSKVRKGALIDGHLSFEEQTATITNLPSALFVLSDDTGVFNLSPEIVTLDGSTVTSTLYELPGGTYLTGAETDLEVEIEMPADSHTWGRLTYTLSTGVVDFMVFQLIVSPIVGSDLPTIGIRQPHITRNWQGHHATCRALAGVGISQLMNGTRCVIVITEEFDGGAVPIEAVQFVGYLTKEGNTTSSATEKVTSFDMASIWERAGQLPMHHIAIRDDATPAAWDEIDLPTPQRVTTHVLARYSTVLNLCALNIDDNGDTWYAGEYNLSSDSIGDTIDTLLKEINAELTQKPSGELFLRRDLRYEDDDIRDDADTIWTLTNRDLSAFDYNARHEEQTGRVIIGVRAFFTNRSASIGGKAAAPNVILGTSPTTETFPAQLMPADSSALALFGDPLDPASVGLTEERAGHILAAANTPYEFSGDAWSGLFWLTPNNFQWIDVNLAASFMTRGRAITGRHLLTGVEIDLDAGGTPIVRLELTPETRGGGGFVVGNLVPNVAALDWTITPIQQPYSGNFGAPSSWNTTDFPPFTRDNMGNQGFPEPQDQSADEAQQSAPAGTRSFAISFAESAAVQMGFVSTLGADYAINMQGSAKIADDAWSHSFDIKTDLDGFAVSPVGAGTWAAGVGVTPAGYLNFNVAQIANIFASSTITSVTMTFDLTKGTFSTVSPVAVIFLNNVIVASVNPADITDGSDLTFSWFGSHAATTDITVSIVTSYDGTIPYAYDGTGAITRVTVTGEGTNPFTGDPGTILYGDGAGYVWNISDEEGSEGEEINISYDGGRGLYIQNAPIASPPLYNESHVYDVTWEGDGNDAEVKYADGNYADNQRVNLNLNVSGIGAGT